MMQYFILLQECPHSWKARHEKDDNQTHCYQNFLDVYLVDLNTQARKKVFEINEPALKSDPAIYKFSLDLADRLSFSEL